MTPVESPRAENKTLRVEKEALRVEKKALRVEKEALRVEREALSNVDNNSCVRARNCVLAWLNEDDTAENAGLDSWVNAGRT